MINFKTENGVFNFRVAGILFNENKVLVHRLLNDDFYAFPGGRVEMFENTENTIIREMKEELDIDVIVNRLLWVSEHFFTHKDSKYHEICFYYLIECEDSNLLEKGDVFYVTEGNNKFEFKWVGLADIRKHVIYPTFIKDKIKDLPITVERIVDVDE